MTEPPEVGRFLAAADPEARDAAWERLVETHSHLLLKVARGLGGGHDRVMDRYAFVLERLRADGFRRVLAYRRDGPARFSTWLVVICRRLCVDEYRARFGRAPVTQVEANGAGLFRRRLALDLPDAVDITTLADDGQAAPDDALDGKARSRHLSGLLTALDPRDQLLLRLRFRDELTAGEIARLMRYPSAFHVYRRVQALLRELKRSLGGDPLFVRGDD